MTNLIRRNQKLFAGNASNNGQFGSLQTTAKVLSNDIDTLQLLAAYENGWNDAVVSGEQLPSLEEFQGLNYINTYQLSYLLQKGVAEYNSETTYYIGDISRAAGSTILYSSLTDDNIGNALTDVVEWKLLGDLSSLKSSTTTTEGVGEIATNAETLSGSETGAKFLNPANLLSIYNSSSFSTNSYERSPVNIGGSFSEGITQYGITSSIAVGANLAVVFPLSFLNSCRSVVVTRIEAIGSNAFSYSVSDVSTTGFTLYSNGARAGAYYWQAKGN